MPTKTKILHRQTSFDLAIQMYGTIEACFDMMLANGKSISDELVPGYELILKPLATIDGEVLNYYKKNQIKPATGKIEIQTTTNCPYSNGFSNGFCSGNIVPSGGFSNAFSNAFNL